MSDRRFDVGQVFVDGSHRLVDAAVTRDRGEAAAVDHDEREGERRHPNGKKNRQHGPRVHQPSALTRNNIENVSSSLSSSSKSEVTITS